MIEMSVRSSDGSIIWRWTVDVASPILHACWLALFVLDLVCIFSLL